ncbi:hypothetical protein ABZ128_09485 [Streptomyces sp. NPDC006326]|uniref:hypothetical protein n=1 Tax=Streptomyces sp. NPDC006326 TaxID=3156752 RepID=UPI0033B36ECA
MTHIDPGDLSDEARMTEGAVRRLELFRAAHTAVTAYAWGETPGVTDVIRVAEFLADGERD